MEVAKTEKEFLIFVKAFIESDNVYVLVPPHLWNNDNLALAIKEAVQVTFSPKPTKEKTLGSKNL